MDKKRMIKMIEKEKLEHIFNDEVSMMINDLTVSTNQDIFPKHHIFRCRRLCTASSLVR